MKKHLSLVFLLLFIGLTVTLPAQTFTEINYSFVNIDGSSDWADYDNDGDLDVLVTGTSQPADNAMTYVYRQRVDGLFEHLASLSFYGVRNGVGKWLDLNNDGLLDIYTSGETIDSYGYESPACYIYMAKPNGTFQLINDNPVILHESSSMDWGDINNDGFVDMAIAGYTSMNPHYHARIYENNQGTLIESTKYKIDSLMSGTLDWADYDNDMDLDLVMTGWRYDWSRGDVWETSVYRNDPDGLTKLDANLKGTNFGSATWGDFDGDGDADILVTGIYGSYDAEMSVFKIYINNGNDSFTALNTPDVPDIYYNGSTWGDIDNDGDLDIIVTGRDESYENEYTYLLLNDNGNITIHSLLCSVQAGSLNLVDYDNDGDLDVFLTGWADYNEHTKIFRNNSTIKNLPPSAPVNLSASREGNVVTFSWDSSTDDHTASANLTYNLFIGTETDNTSLLQPNANISSGYREIVDFGNAGYNNSWKITLPETVTSYTWGVQAIDNSFLGSPFAVDAPVVLSPTVYTDQPSGFDLTAIDLNGRVNTHKQSLNVWFEYGTDTTQLINTPEQLVTVDTLINISANITGLQYNSLYHYRLVAGAVKGEFVSFQTQPDGLEERILHFEIYPNPTQRLLKYTIKDPAQGIIMIYDMQGQKHLQFKVTQVTGTIDLGELKSGVYNLVYVAGNRIANRKIIVE